MVKRWFLNDDDGEMIDGPYSNRQEAVEAQTLHEKLYKIRLNLEEGFIQALLPAEKPRPFNFYRGY